MTKMIFTLFFQVMFSYAVLYAQSSSVKQDYTADIDYFHDQLIARHKNLFVNISRKVFDSLTNDLKSHASELSRETFIVRLCSINALIADEHTRIDPGFEKVFPLRFDYFDEGLAIILSDSANSRYLSCRLLAIDNHTVDEVITKLSGILKKDNASFIKFWIAYYCNKPELLKGLGIIEQEKEAHFRLLTLQGDSISVIIGAVPVDQAGMLQKAEPLNNLMAFSRDDFYWYQFDTTYDALYFNYTQCAEDDHLPFETFNRQLFKEIELRRPSKLIVDLRYNGGGYSSVLNPFLRSIRSSYLNAEGKLYVLIGRKTFSSALMNAVELVKENHAIAVGEPTGANINHFGEVRSFELPISRITVYYSTKFWNNWPGHDGPLLPDILIHHSYNNFLKGEDEALEYIRKQ
ncbi:MAG: hypothetical protein K1X61_14565 [Chitinophagales bacterium]|nr:hypothetical protein [Chitinophagales bacterium]